MTEKFKSRKWQCATIIGLIALLWTGLHIFSQLARIDLPHAQQAGDSPDRSASSDSSADKFVPTKITCLEIIREDYEGLRLSYPCKVFVDPVKKEVYVNDSGNSRILVYTHDFYPLLSVGKPDGVESPVGLAVDPEGYLFIAQSPTGKHKKGRVSVLNPCLRWKKDILFDGFEGADDFNPTDIAINHEGHLYVTGTAYRGVVVLDKDGRFSHLLTPTDKLGKGPEEKATICDVEIDNRGRIYLLSEDMGRIYVYDSQERFLFKFGQKGGGSGKLSRPRGIAVDSRNKRIYVIDYMRHTASAYSDDGRFLFEFGGKGWTKGWFQYPSDIAVDTFGNVLVADTFNNRVQVLKEKKDKALIALMEERKATYGVEKSIDMIVKPDESIKVGEETVRMKKILDEVRLKQGEILETDLVTGARAQEPGEFGIHVVQPGENIWNIHFEILKDYYDRKGIQVSPLADEPDRLGYSSGVGKILKFSENLVYIYNLKERKLEIDLNLIYPLSKIVIYNMSRVFALLDRIDYKDINRIWFDGETLWFPAV